MSIYAEPQIHSKSHVIDIWLHDISLSQDLGDLQHSIDILAIQNYVDTTPKKLRVKTITSTLNGIMHTTLWDNEAKEDAWIEISPEYTTPFLEALRDLEIAKKETHVLRALFRAILNEASNWMELYLMLPKCARYLWNMNAWGWPSMANHPITSVDDYQKALQKAIAFSRRNKTSIDVLKQRVFLNNLIKP